MERVEAGQKKKGREKEENEKLRMFAEASILRGDPDVQKLSQPPVRVGRRSQEAVEADDQGGNHTPLTNQFCALKQNPVAL